MGQGGGRCTVRQPTVSRTQNHPDTHAHLSTPPPPPLRSSWLGDTARRVPMRHHQQAPVAPDPSQPPLNGRRLSFPTQPFKNSLTSGREDKVTDGVNWAIMPDQLAVPPGLFSRGLAHPSGFSGRWCNVHRACGHWTPICPSNLNAVIQQLNMEVAAFTWGLLPGGMGLPSTAIDKEVCAHT